MWCVVYCTVGYQRDDDHSLLVIVVCIIVLCLVSLFSLSLLSAHHPSPHLSLIKQPEPRSSDYFIWKL